MLTDVLKAKVSWPDGNTMQGKVMLNYIEAQDPWLIHATFEVQNATDQIEVERIALIEAANNLTMGGAWVGLTGSPIRIGSGTSFVRFRMTSHGGDWIDFDVSKKDVRTFLAKTVELCDITSEKAALSAHVEKGLCEL